MKTNMLLILICAVCLALAEPARGITYFVATNGNDAAVGTNWLTARKTIQSAVDSALSGDTVLVSNGVYETGARAMPGLIVSNRVVIDKPLVVQSLNGPAVTTIRGNGPSGSNAVRCVWMTNGATLAGFTLTNGAVRSSSESTNVANTSAGGVWAESMAGVLTNCIMTGNQGVAARNATLTHCLVIGNTFGASAVVLNHCDISDNSFGGVSSSTLSNCTLTDNGGRGAYGSTLSHCIVTRNAGGGVESSTLSHCILEDNGAADLRLGGGAMDSVLTNCTLTGNSALSSGGTHGCTMYNCTLIENRAFGELQLCVPDPIVGGCGSFSGGGGASGGAMHGCVVISNRSDSIGGGIYSVYASNCVLVANTSVNVGGGAMNSDLHNCTLLQNDSFNGGGAAASRLSNCLLADNTASNVGGGADSSDLTNCTVVGNSAGNSGGVFSRVISSSLPGGSLVFTTNRIENCIVYHNHAPVDPDYGGVANFNFTCTTPLPPTGSGNITNDPRFMSISNGNFRLRPDSPCINAGSNTRVPRRFPFTTFGVYPDLDLHRRIRDGVVDMGAYEFGHDTNLIHFVDVGNATPEFPFASWATAATNIQDAINIAEAGDTVLVSNGVYQTGGRAVAGSISTNRVTLDKAVRVQSVNGPAVTTIRGQLLAVRCAYVTNGAMLAGFTLTNGSSLISGSVTNDRSGGGAWCAPGGVISNCLITGCFANNRGGGVFGGVVTDTDIVGNFAFNGAGAAESTLNRCSVRNNEANDSGGGALDGSLTNCLVTGNVAIDGGGTHGCGLVNCTVVANIGANNGGGSFGGSAVNSILYGNTSSGASNYLGVACSFSLAAPFSAGSGNIVVEPLFEDATSGNFRLLDGSPGIDAGFNAVAGHPYDRDGFLRIVGGTVDMGAYESRGINSDQDNDGFTDFEEAVSDTDPINGQSFFPRVEVQNAPLGEMAFIIEQTTNSRIYGIYINTNLLESPQAWTLVPPEQTGTASSLTLTITNALPAANYRTGVRLP